MAKGLAAEFKCALLVSKARIAHRHQGFAYLPKGTAADLQLQADGLAAAAATRGRGNGNADSLLLARAQIDF